MAVHRRLVSTYYGLWHPLPYFGPCAPSFSRCPLRFATLPCRHSSKLGCHLQPAALFAIFFETDEVSAQLGQPVFDSKPFRREPVAQVRQRVDFVFDAMAQFV